MRRTEWLVLGTALMLSACGMIPERQEASGDAVGKVTLDAGEIIAEVERVGELSDEQARQRHDQLDSGDEGDDQVRVLLLQLYGPASVRDTSGARSRLASLLSPDQRFRHDSGRAMLALIGQYEERIQVLQVRVGGLSGALAEEQAAHAATYEKLEALRQIEEAMDESARTSNGEQGEHDGGR